MVGKEENPPPTPPSGNLSGGIENIPPVPRNPNTFQDSTVLPDPEHSFYTLGLQQAVAQGKTLDEAMAEFSKDIDPTDAFAMGAIKTAYDHLKAQEGKGSS